MHNIFLRWILPQKAVGILLLWGTPIMGWCPLHFWHSRSLPAHVQMGKFSLTSGVVILSLYFNKVQLLPLALSLECLGENKASLLLHLTNTSCPAQGHIYFLPQYLRLGKTSSPPYTCPLAQVKSNQLWRSSWDSEWESGERDTEPQGSRRGHACAGRAQRQCSMNNLSTRLCVFHIDLCKYLNISCHSPPALSPFCFMLVTAIPAPLSTWGWKDGGSWVHHP